MFILCYIRTPQTIRLEFLPTGERTPEQLRPVPGRQGHFCGANRQLGPDSHPAADGRTADTT